MNHGFVKVAAAVPLVQVADCRANAREIEKQIIIAEGKGVQVVVFPELSMTGYSCGDLFTRQLLLEEAELSLMQILGNTRQLHIVSIVGMPLEVNGVLLNTAVVIQKGKILGVVPKTFLPNHGEFNERRWFASALDVPEKQVRLCGQLAPLGGELLFEVADTVFGVEICEDLWAGIPPSSTLALRGAEIIFNLCADTEGMGKHRELCSLLARQSAGCIAGYVLSTSGFGESTTDVVPSGNGFIYENGEKLACGERFSFKEQLIISEIDVEYLRNRRRVNTTFAASRAAHIRQEGVRVATEYANDKELPLVRTFTSQPFIPQGVPANEWCEEIFSIQVVGLAKRLVHTDCRNVLVGISGGLDSTLALLVCVRTFDKLGWKRTGIIGVTMPGFGTTDRTYTNAVNLMKQLGITSREVSIKDACLQHFKDIGHNPEDHSVVYENAQARERTQVLMDIANQVGGLVVGTGDLSELALGWATYNGDHMSMYDVNGGVPKTLVRHLVKWVAEYHIDEAAKATLLDITDTPISPELIPADEHGNIRQVTEDLVGPYELHDFFIYHFLYSGFRPSKIFFMATRAFKGVYDEECIKKWLRTFFRRFFNQQFKRSCLSDGPKVCNISLSPRGGWSMASDASAESWLKEVDSL